MKKSSVIASYIVLTMCNLLVAAVVISHDLSPIAAVTCLLGLCMAQVLATILFAGLRRFIAPENGFDADSVRQITQIAAKQEELEKQQETFEDLRVRTAAEFESLTSRLEDRERDLAQRLVQYQEILNYPKQSDNLFTDDAQAIQLTEKDQKTNRLLEAEAERVYEKIRKNGYWVNGTLDVTAIRIEVHDLIHRIAHIYSPNSEHPLLETSFEQLARAASRICLHTLVLLEQLPLGVQKSNFKSLYGYFQKAVAGYGAYKTAAPWLTYLSRGVYAGRLAAAGNPVTLGAWWLATEVGKRGAAKLVENVVDKQAIAVLHDLVTVIGVEVAGIYGPGYRQRDAAWILGTELVELISRFPISRDSLSEGLRQVTALRLRNEYDRIYLYRCLATHKPSGMRLADPAMLSREHREHVAATLESFFQRHIHGATAESGRKWREEFEERFDLKLKFEGTNRFASTDQQAAEALKSLAGFLRHCCGWTGEKTRDHLRTCQMLGQVPESVRAGIVSNDHTWTCESQFHPPDIDPAMPITDSFLQELARVAVVCHAEDHQSIESLILEAGAYFRRAPGEVHQLLDQQYQLALASLSGGKAMNADLDRQAIRSILNHRNIGEMLEFAYPNIARIAPDSYQDGGTTSSSQKSERGAFEVIDAAWLVGFRRKDDLGQRILLLNPNHPDDCVWKCEGTIVVQREKRILVDDAIVSGGTWCSGEFQSADSRLLVSGSLRGGRFKSFFQPLLAFTQTSLDS